MKGSSAFLPFSNLPLKEDPLLLFPLRLAMYPSTPFWGFAPLLPLEPLPLLALPAKRAMRIAK